METYDETEIEVRMEKPPNLPSEVDSRPLGETIAVETVMESETRDLDRPVRIKRPTFWFSIDEYLG